MSKKECKEQGCTEAARLLERCRKHYQNIPAVNKRRKAWDVSPLGRYRSYKSRSKRKGREFVLTQEEFINLISDACFYCGIKRKRMGVDRLVNSIGYNLDNCITACSNCNYLRGNRLSVGETKKLVKTLKRLRKDNDPWTETLNREQRLKLL